MIGKALLWTLFLAGLAVLVSFVVGTLLGIVTAWKRGSWLDSIAPPTFIFLGAFAAGTLAGGPIGDRIGRKRVIWFSILGPLPFTLLLPHVGLFWTVALTVVIGVILSSAFSASGILWKFSSARQATSVRSWVDWRTR